MKNIFLAHFKRYFWVSVLISGIIFMGLAIQALMVQGFYYESGPRSLLYLGSVVAGILLGRAHFDCATKPTLYAFWVHRPIDVRAQFLSIATAGFALLFVMLSMPLLLILAYIDHFFIYPIFSHHYQLVPTVWLFASIGYLLGSLIKLKGGSKRYFCLVVVCILYLGAPVHSTTIIGMYIFGFVALLYLNLDTQRMRSSDHLQRKPSTFLLTLGFGIFFIVCVQIIFELADFMRMSTDRQYVELIYSKKPYDNEAEQLLRQAAEENDEIDVNVWSKALDDQESQINIRFLPYDKSDRTDNHNIRVRSGTAVEDWYFDPSNRHFVGINKDTNQQLGWLGVNGFSNVEQNSTTNGFTSNPVDIRLGHLVTRQAAYKIDFDSKKIHQVVKLKDGNRFINSWRLLEDTYTTATAVFINKDNQPLTQIDYPMVYTDIEKIIVYPNNQQYLALFVARSPDSFSETDYALVHVKNGGTSKVVAQLSKPSDSSFSYVNQTTFMFSPTLGVLFKARGLTSLERRLNTHLAAIHSTKYPYAFYLVQLLICLLSTFVIWRLTRRQADRSSQKLWIGLSLTFSLPAVFAYFLLNKQKLQ